MDLDAKVVLVTGASRGLGRATALAAAGAGATVVLASRSQADLDRVVAEIAKAGGQASARATDVGELDQVEALLEHAIREHGGVDVWINNAGSVGPFGPTIDVPPEAFMAVVRTNIHGTYHGSIVAVRHFRARGRGTLINLLGRGDRRPVAKQNAYAASKTWIRGFTLALAKELEDQPAIRILAVNPGLVDTDLLRRIDVIRGHEGDLDVFPTIVHMWARPPEIPAARLIEIAADDRLGAGGRRVEQQMFGFGSTLWRSLRYAIRKLLGRAGPRPQLELRGREPWDGGR